MMQAGTSPAAYAAPKIAQALEELCAGSPLVNATVVRDAVGMTDDQDTFDAAVKLLIDGGVIQLVGETPQRVPLLRHTGISAEEALREAQEAEREELEQAARERAAEMEQARVDAEESPLDAEDYEDDQIHDDEPSAGQLRTTGGWIDPPLVAYGINRPLVSVTFAIANALGPDGMGKLVMAGLTDAESRGEAFTLVVTP